MHKVINKDYKEIKEIKDYSSLTYSKSLISYRSVLCIHLFYLYVKTIFIYLFELTVVKSDPSFYEILFFFAGIKFY